jgi:hypothetical protein
MRCLVLVIFAACAVEPTSLEGPIPCGGMTCGSGQICFSRESGSQCNVDPEAGIGPYQEFGWTCQELPSGCDGVTRTCFPGDFTRVSDDGRYVVQACI